MGAGTDHVIDHMAEIPQLGTPLRDAAQPHGIERRQFGQQKSRHFLDAEQ